MLCRYKRTTIVIPVTESWWKCDDMKLMPMSQLSAMSIYFEICCCDQITPTRTVSMCSLKHIIINAFKSNHYKNNENKTLYLNNMHPQCIFASFSFSSTSRAHCPNHSWNLSNLMLLDRLLNLDKILSFCPTYSWNYQNPVSINDLMTCVTLERDFVLLLAVIIICS